MSDDENVIMFPSPGSEPTTLEAVRHRVAAIREAFVESSVEQVMSSVLDSLSRAGFDVYSDEGNAKDVALVHLALKSLLMKSRGDYHHLQSMAEDMFEVDEEEGYVYLRAEEASE